MTPQRCWGRGKVKEKREFYEPVVPAFTKGVPPRAGLRQRLLELGVERGLECRIQRDKNFVRRSRSSCLLGSIPRRVGKAHKIWPVFPLDRIHCVINRRVHDRKAAGWMDRG